MQSRTIEVTVVKCPFCGYTWIPRVVSPRSCPACKRYLVNDGKQEAEK